MSTDTRSVVQEFLVAFNDRDTGRLSGLLADDVVEHGIDGTVKGAEAVIERLERQHTIFPDYAGTVHDIAVDGDLATVRYTASGTHAGAYQDLQPTGVTVSWTGLAMYRVEDGEIAETWLEEDRLGLLEQLELVETADPAHLRL